jgi:uncharacterized PurR-regulated membrane protein YhhQ (DUF165 family)
VVGQALDSGIFILIAFYGGAMGLGALGTMILTHWLVKVGYEVIATPFTYMIVGYLKKKEGIDTYDTKTNFNPFLVFPFSLLARGKADKA